MFSQTRRIHAARRAKVGRMFESMPGAEWRRPGVTFHVEETPGHWNGYNYRCRVYTWKGCVATHLMR